VNDSQDDGTDDSILKSCHDANLNYDVSKGVATALDYDSLSVFTLLYNYETILNWYAVNFGLDPDEYNGFKIVYAPTEVEGAGGLVRKSKEKTNASYLEGHKVFVINKAGTIELLPLSMNVGIITHEFTHSIIDLKVMQRKKEELSRAGLDNFEALHEGFADFFALVFTSDPKVFTKTVKGHTSREYPVSFNYDDYTDHEKCDGETQYCLGSVIASSLYDVHLNNKDISLMEIARLVYSSFDNIKEKWFAADKIDNADVILSRLHFNGISETHSSFELTDLLNAITAKLPDNGRKKLYCQSYSKWFARIKDNIDECKSL
jgi:hypothetical protein